MESTNENTNSAINFSILDFNVLLDNDASDEYIGVNGEYTWRQSKTFKVLKLIRCVDSQSQ